MADQKISEMTAATTPLVGTEAIPAVQGGGNVTVTPTMLKAFMVANSANVYGYVTAYADLPLGTTVNDPEVGDLVGVNTTTGVWLLGTQRRMGFYKRVALSGVAATDYGTTPFSGFPINEPKTLTIKFGSDTIALTTGDGKYIFTIPFELDGYNLTKAEGTLTTVSSSGAITMQVRNITDSVDMLSTAITIDVSEFNSYTAATPSVVNTSYDDVATGDRIAIDIDAAGTGAMGAGVILTFEKP
jgi:hypothetical protein